MNALRQVSGGVGLGPTWLAATDAAITRRVEKG